MTRPSLVDRLVSTVAGELERLASPSRVVVGVSGGPDSSGLLWLVATARPDLDLVAVHIRHGLRDDEEDVRVVHELAQQVRAGLEVVEVDVVPAGEGLESAARTARHAALQQVAGQRGASAVLLGHTTDDQAETVLLRLARGTTLRGASGMRVWRDDVLGTPVGRPILGLGRQEIHKLVAEVGLPVVHDPTNDDPAFARNVVRATVLPGLAVHAGDPASSLARFAQRAAEDDEHLRFLAASIVASHAWQDGESWLLPPGAMHDQPSSIARRVVEILLERVRPEVGVVADEVDDILGLRVDRRVDRRGVVVVRHGRSVRFARNRDAGSSH